jgi:hypothetical protein
LNPLERVLDIESRLNQGAISVDQACAELFAGPKPWSTGWWKGQRSERIGSECSTCGSADPPLVLQHTWQPVSWQEALRQVGPPNWEWWKERYPLPRLAGPERPLIERPVCPTCGSIRFRQRKRTNDWVCQAGQCGAPHERHADYTFAEPKTELRPDTRAIRLQNRAMAGEYQELSRARWQAWLQSPEGAENRLKALRLYMEDSKRYLSLRDTKTLCRSCAAREDYHHIRRSELDAVELRLERDVLEFRSELDQLEGTL